MKTSPKPPVNMNYFTLDVQGKITYANVNSYQQDCKLVIDENLWEVLPSLRESDFYHACKLTLDDQQNCFVEFQFNQNQWWETTIYPIPSGLAIYANEVSEKKKIESQLKISQANLKATINNTEVLIYSLDKELRFISFNTPFENYLKKYFHVDPNKHLDFVREFLELNDEFSRRWKDVYRTVLDGGTIMFESSKFGMDYQFSLGPIFEDGLVIGVTSFGCNITKRNARERELSEANQTIGRLKMMNLRSAMNSHFIFNTLNSIQYYILDNDRKNAVHYLSSFAKLIRDVLISTVADKVRLGDEINLIQNYIALEQMRFENKFDVEMIVDDQLDREIEIPPMLIQPYVENAIVHGLANKKERGQLTLRFKNEGGSIRVEIDDDGVGRPAAALINQRIRKTHKSVSTKMTEDRMALINAMDHVSIQVIDKQFEDYPLGTQVILTMEFRNEKSKNKRVQQLEQEGRG